MHKVNSCSRVNDELSLEPRLNVSKSNINHFSLQKVIFMINNLLQLPLLLLLSNGILKLWSTYWLLMHLHLDFVVGLVYITSYIYIFTIILNFCRFLLILITNHLHHFIIYHSHLDNSALVWNILLLIWF